MGVLHGVHQSFMSSYEENVVFLGGLHIELALLKVMGAGPTPAGSLACPV